jgi:glycine oxidase
VASARPDIAIVGGGIIGLACARELALAGAQVVVLERGEPGRESSWAAAGMLAPLSEVRHPGAMFEACRDGRDLWPEWHGRVSAEAGVEVEYDRSGTFVVAANDAEEQVLEEMAAAARRLGEPIEDVPMGEVFVEVPDLRPESRRAIRLPGEHRVDNVRLCEALVVAVERVGVEVRRGAQVGAAERTPTGVRLRLSDGSLEVTQAVLAGGAWSGQIAGVEPLPVRPVRGQMLRLDGAAWPWRGCVRVLGRYYGIRRGAQGLLVGATVEETGFVDHTTPAGVASLLSVVATAWPGLAEARLVEVWSGLRPGSPDDQPIVGRYRDWPLWIASGHFRNGILLAPWTALKIAPWALGTSDEPADNPFRWARFAAESL